ncbi:DUF1997 domain-containing protein [Chamaesiphon polymorphus]|uniref:DUF1997 domain-containing protein n=1 Tax=Chamaesiphon polymorphus CCALA 037 TaxID=2107692 RepID=A0A2T1GIY0_9CYAN|nr:DUF1997 domain-containing protein [Chamaesiphon polymorphus]PSB57704.1 hypothetical protein C7B77_07410 [Chamaesiphon polymorphus CCALA 037]
MQIVKFTADRSVDIAVPKQPIPIGHYLRQPHRLVNALVDPSRIQQLSEDEFRLSMRTLNFFGIELQPTVYLRVWTEADGTVRIASTKCEIRGIDYIDRRFSLQLMGKLSPYEAQGQTYLEGLADLQVQVDLPPPLNFMPRSMVESAGNSLLKGILNTFKQRLLHQLIADYILWANTGTEGTSTKPSTQPQAPHLG